MGKDELRGPRRPDSQAQRLLLQERELSGGGVRLDVGFNGVSDSGPECGRQERASRARGLRDSKEGVMSCVRVVSGSRKTKTKHQKVGLAARWFLRT